jgi:hypothetical protein
MHHCVAKLGASEDLLVDELSVLRTDTLLRSAPLQSSSPHEDPVCDSAGADVPPPGSMN